MIQKGKLLLSKLRRQIKLFMHRGTKYICPLCNYSQRDLYIIGIDIPVLRERQVIGGGKRFGGCYKCGSSDRERLIYLYLKNKLNIFDSNKKKSILHIAPEKNISKKIFEYGFSEYICGDLFTTGYNYPKHVQNINVLDMPFGNNIFDLVICNHVLEHIPTDLKAMKEIWRVLKKGGKAILQVPISANSNETFEDFSVTDPQQREIVFGQFDHIRIYGQDYVTRLVHSGFKVNRNNISNALQKYGVNLTEDVFECEKVEDDNPLV